VSQERELASWRAYLETGSMKAAAHRLGVHEQTVKQHLARLRRQYRVTTNAQLAVALEREGVA
jgi:DNA-binding CsgD family transcriptional regulator